MGSCTHTYTSTYCMPPLIDLLNGNNFLSPITKEIKGLFKMERKNLIQTWKSGFDEKEYFYPSLLLSVLLLHCMAFLFCNCLLLYFTTTPPPQQQFISTLSHFCYCQRHGSVHAEVEFSVVAAPMNAYKHFEAAL